MKKHKRDVHRRAYLKGYQPGISGRSRDDCPVAEQASWRTDWQAGWRDGRSGFWEGKIGVSGIQSNPMMSYLT